MNQHGVRYQLFDCDKKYTGLTRMFYQLVINNVDTDAKRASVETFLDGVATVCGEQSITLYNKSDVIPNWSGSANSRIVVVRPDDALDSSCGYVTAWYMVSETAFATAKAFLQMSSDRPVPPADAPVPVPNPELEKLRKAVLEGDLLEVERMVDSEADACGSKYEVVHQAVQRGHHCVVHYLAKHFHLSRSKVCGAHGEHVQAALKMGHTTIVTALAHRFQMSKGQVCGKDCSALHSAIKAGHLQVVKDVVDMYDFERHEVLGKDNEVLYHAVLNNHSELVKYLIAKLKLVGKSQ